VSNSLDLITAHRDSGNQKKRNLGRGCEKLYIKPFAHYLGAGSEFLAMRSDARDCLFILHCIRIYWMLFFIGQAREPAYHMFVSVSANHTRIDFFGLTIDPLKSIISKVDSWRLMARFVLLII
jgi:hypothetical protein